MPHRILLVAEEEEEEEDEVVKSFLTLMWVRDIRGTGSIWSETTRLQAQFAGAGRGGEGSGRASATSRTQTGDVTKRFAVVAGL